MIDDTYGTYFGGRILAGCPSMRTIAYSLAPTQIRCWRPENPRDWHRHSSRCSTRNEVLCSRFLTFFSDLFENVSLEEPRQIRFFVLASNISTTSVPTVYVLIDVS